MSEATEELLITVIWICLLLSAAFANGVMWYWKGKYHKMSELAGNVLEGWQKTVDTNDGLIKLVDEAAEHSKQVCALNERLIKMMQGFLPHHSVCEKTSQVLQRLTAETRQKK